MPAGAALVELTTPVAVAAEFGDAAPRPAGRSEYMAALGIKILSLPEAARRLRCVPGLRVKGCRVVVPADAAFNTTVVLSE